MATSTGNFVADNSSLANFKSWAQFISNALSAFGWVQTSDTGQVNWSSIAAVPSSTFVYEIWKANDSQASTTPIYLKIEYGFSSSAVSFRMTFGTGSNGSGTITGANRLFSTNNGNPGNQGGTTFPCYASGDAGEFRLLMWQGNSNVSFSVGIERSKDSSGNKTTDYFTAWTTCATSSSGIAQASVLGSLVTNSGPLVSCLPGGGTGTFNGTTSAGPVFPVVGKFGNPMLGCCSACNGDVAEGASVTVNIYGANHTYIATKLGAYANTGLLNSNGQSSGAFLMRYE